MTCSPECTRLAQRDELIQVLFAKQHEANALNFKMLTIMFGTLGAIATACVVLILVVFPTEFSLETWPFPLTILALGALCIAGAIFLNRVKRQYASIVQRLAELARE